MLHFKYCLPYLNESRLYDVYSRMDGDILCNFYTLEPKCKCVLQEFDIEHE